MHCQVYPFPFFVKEGILCSIIGHVLKERKKKGGKKKQNKDGEKNLKDNEMKWEWDVEINLKLSHEL